MLIGRHRFRGSVDSARFSGAVTRPRCVIYGDAIYEETEGRAVTLPEGFAHADCAKEPS